MSAIVEFTVDCPQCDGTATAGSTLFLDHEPGTPLRINLALSASQLSFTCEQCGAHCYSGDFDVLSEEDM
jgi:hypothetical protein